MPLYTPPPPTAATTAATTTAQGSFFIVSIFVLVLVIIIIIIIILLATSTTPNPTPHQQPSHTAQRRPPIIHIHTERVFGHDLSSRCHSTSNRSISTSPLTHHLINPFNTTYYLALSIHYFQYALSSIQPPLSIYPHTHNPLSQSTPPPTALNIQALFCPDGYCSDKLVDACVEVIDNRPDTLLHTLLI